MTSASEEARLLPLEEDDDDIPTICSKKRLCFVILVTFTILAVLAVIVTVAIGWAQKLASEIPDPAYALSEAVTVENIMVHLEKLNMIATENEGSRSVQYGYDASAQYIIQKLNEGAGCEIDSSQSFPTAIYTELEPPRLSMTKPFPLDFQLKVDFAGLRYGGNRTGNIANQMCSVHNFGCSASDFSNVTTGCIALIKLNSTDDCLLINKTMTAQDFGAGAVILYNPIDVKILPTTRVRGSGLTEKDLMKIPVLVGSYSLGSFLSQLPEPVFLELFTSTTIEIITTYNVFCVTTEGKGDNVIVAGAHLDSVPEGPGINDNGSGSATLLEIVLQWYALGMQPINKIRFAWWGSEEVGLIGSRYFVDNLKDDELKNIAMALNFDMLGSPNYQIGIHNGETAVKAQNGSAVITTMFVEYLEYLEKDYNLIPLVSGSDFVPFVEREIPSGGLAAGASGTKSPEERDRFGGFANAPYDPCYHLSCDTVENVDLNVLYDMAGAAAYVIQKSAEHENLRSFLDTPIEAVSTHTGSLGLVE